MSVISMPQIVGSTRKLVMLLEVPPGDHENGNFLHRWRQGRGAEQGAFWFVVSMWHIQCGQKINTVKELDPVNNPFTAFFKIEPHTKRSNMSKGRGRGAEQVANCHFWFVISIWHDQCGQKLAQWSYLTLGTSLILKRCFFSKFASLTPHREVKVQNLT